MIDDAARERIQRMYDEGLAWYMTLLGTKWRGEGDEQHRELKELDSAHRQNLLNWIDARGPRIVSIAYWGSAKYWSHELSMPHGEWAEYALEQISDEECEEMLWDPIGRLHRSRFYSTLAALVAGDVAAVALPERPAGAPLPRAVPLEV